MFGLQQEKIARNRKNLFNVVEQLKWYALDCYLRRKKQVGHDYLSLSVAELTQMFRTDLNDFKRWSAGDPQNN